ncbi:MAG: thiamine pyrophosphate-dependent dehydrogenase E1 component subunit alpha [Desulfuromonadaceae bacterium]|nr:thiamine pyrophosphate-dependent dehydrogenase E1 component subunit alpha [Desulfuromonadaceae bacterium]MDD2854324.1 thiamine pyrophosphate-dependent dehydrogenase E1 component subunit alpha [Desulfuromonadaceae bacterium]
MNLPDISKTELLRLYESLTRIRLFEERIVDLYHEQEMKTPVHLCIGQEAVAVGVCSQLEREDYIFSTHRSHGHCIAKGMQLRSIAAELYGMDSGCARGRGGSMHLVDPDCGIPGSTAIVGGSVPLAVGAALSAKMQGNGRIAVAFFGDGATEEGSFHESLNFAALHKLPVIFICENNFYATNSHIKARQPAGRIASKGAGYGVPSHTADGNSLGVVYEFAAKAIKLARDGGGPTLLEFETYRWKSHVGPASDFQTGCRSESELLKWKERCPNKLYRTDILKAGMISSEELDTIDKMIKSEIDDSFEFVRTCKQPDINTLLDYVC